MCANGGDGGEGRVRGHNTSMSSGMYPNGEVLVDNCRLNNFGSTFVSSLEEEKIYSSMGSYHVVILG